MNNAPMNQADVRSNLFSHVPVLRRYAFHLLHNASDADDLVQDCLVRALSRAHLFEPGTNLKAWLLSIIHNVFLDGTRRQRRARAFDKAMTATHDHVTRPNQLHRLELADADKALAALPPVQSATLLLIGLDGLSYIETAKITGAPVGTVRSRVSRGRSALTAIMRGVTPEDRAAELVAYGASYSSQPCRANV
jgi:RNA polymerase sigma-70 factor (ECF subfamily)